MTTTREGHGDNISGKKQRMILQEGLFGICFSTSRQCVPKDSEEAFFKKI